MQKTWSRLLLHLLPKLHSAWTHKNTTSDHVLKGDPDTKEANEENKVCSIQQYHVQCKYKQNALTCKSQTYIS